MELSKKTHNWGVLHASKDEWGAIKDLINHVAQPEIFHASEIDVMSGMEYEDWQLWVNKFNNYPEPPKLIGRSELGVIFATANNVEDAKVQGLTDEHMETVEEILRHSMNDAVEFG